MPRETDSLPPHAANKRATITDVAKHAGVSLATVSRVMNGNPKVDRDMADRVRASASELGYTASPLARSLKLGRTQTVAVLVPDLENPTFQALLRGISRAASADGFHVLIADSAEQVDEEQVLIRELRQRTDGLVLCAPRSAREDLSRLLDDPHPTVVINREPFDGTDTISGNYGEALYALVEHLHGLGHRHLAYLAGSTHSASNTARLGALHRAMVELADLTVDELPAGVDFDSGSRSADAVLETGATAVLAYNDLVAMGLLSALTERGVRVPEDLSLAGFDDIPFSRFTTPPLTTVTVPVMELGRMAWSALHARLEGHPLNANIVLQPTLAPRSSTGPASAE